MMKSPSGETVEGKPGFKRVLGPDCPWKARRKAWKTTGDSRRCHRVGEPIRSWLGGGHTLPQPFPSVHPTPRRTKRNLRNRGRSSADLRLYPLLVSCGVGPRPDLEARNLASREWATTLPLATTLEPQLFTAGRRCLDRQFTKHETRNIGKIAQ